MSSQRRVLIWAMGQCLVAALISGVAAQTGLQDPPVLSRPPAATLCSYTGPLVHVPSKSAGTEGLLVRISPPARAVFTGSAYRRTYDRESTECDRIARLSERPRFYRRWLSVPW